MEREELIKQILETPKPLSEEQKRAVLSKSRYLRIVAGAGTGKTETMTRRIAYLLLCEKVKPNEIVAFTFTEKAAQNMKSRIYERVRELKGEEECARLGEMFVGTIHSFCFRILEDKFGYGDHEPLDENQEMAFLMREGWSLGLGKQGNYTKNCADFLRSVDVVYNELIDRQKLRGAAPDFAENLERYEEKLARHRLITFGQMIAKTVELLEQNPEIISHIKHLIVDEYQDINRAQDKLIRIIGKNASVFVVGDPRQCIYQWRGSDESCFEEFLHAFPNCESISIRENWRSVPKIVNVANNFAKNFERARYEPLVEKRSEEGETIVFTAQNPEQEAEWIIRQIKLLMSRNKDLTYRDFAILLRSVSTSARPFIEVFKREGIPFIVGGTVGLFQRDEAQAVGMLFAWLHDDGFWQSSGFGSRRRIEGENLLNCAIKKWKEAVGENLVPPNLKESLIAWREKVRNSEYSCFTAIYQDLLVTLGFHHLDPNDKLHAAIMANLGRFNSLLTDYETSIRLGGQKPRWNSVLKGLYWFINSYAISAYEERLAEDIRGINAVQIMTVHQAKGLEWPVVFVPCLTSKRFPSSKTGQAQDWFIPRDSGLFDVNRYEGGLEDEKRLFYVAITRARDILCLSYFRKLRSGQRPSDFLNCIASLIDTRLIISNNLPEVRINTHLETEEIQTFSTSEIITYLRCPYLYCLRELWGFKPKLVEALGYGKSLHYCLRHASELIQKGGDPKKTVEILIEEKFHLPFASGEAFENMKSTAKEVLTRFIIDHLDDIYRIKEVEARLEFPLEKATIVGRVDVIIRHDKDKESVEVRDYKTSDAVTTYEESSLQLQLYSLGLKKINQPVEAASIAYLEQEKEGGNDIERVSVSTDDLQKASELAKSCINGIKNSFFRAKPGDQCKSSCDYDKICRWSNTR